MPLFKKKSFFERLTGSIPLTDGQRPPGEGETAEENGDGELAVDIYQTSSEIVIQAMIAGVKPENLEIAIGRELVTIKGNREPAGNTGSLDYFQKELYWGSFSRTILLPAEIEVEETEAVEKHGLLTIRLPKIDKAKTQNLKVKSL